jgi:hypothetical protein
VIISKSRKSTRFEVFVVVTMKKVVFWDVTPCGSCKYWRFGGTQRLHHQGEKFAVCISCQFLVHQFLSPWWWRLYVPPKRRFLQEPHDVTPQKTVLFIGRACSTWQFNNTELSNSTHYPDKFMNEIETLWKLGVGLFCCLNFPHNMQISDIFIFVIFQAHRSDWIRQE